MKVKLKVCGITSLHDALVAIDCGANYLGFNFYAKSPRCLAPIAASEIIDRLPREIITVGIFVNEPGPEKVVETMQTSGVHLAQLHGDEDAAYCAAVGAARVIKALRVGKDFRASQVLEYPATAILLDAYDQNLYGGTGKTANWDVAREAAKLARVFLAGGLSPENIADAIRAVEPFAVDVNSGVESAPGRKDRVKLESVARILSNEIFQP
jgi:phosphoribosylanthranilate isomerase